MTKKHKFFNQILINIKNEKIIMKNWKNINYKKLKFIILYIDNIIKQLLIINLRKGYR